MIADVLSREERERLLRALEEDREFRYALMGLLGFKELLDRFTRLEERQQKLEERLIQLEERFAKLEERVIALEERFAKLEERLIQLEERLQKLEERMIQLEERFAKLEERVIALEERLAKLEERFAKLEERVIQLEERQQKLEERFEVLNRTVIVIAHRFGIIAEEGFREAMKYVLEDIFGVAKVERWIYSDTKGSVYGYPSVIEVDVVIKDNVHILVELKSRVSKGDVAELSRIGKLYEEVAGIKPKLVVIGGFIDPDAYEAARRLDVELKPIT